MTNIIKPYIEEVDLEAIALSIPKETTPTPKGSSNHSESPAPQTSGNQITTKPKEGFIYVPSINLSFSKERAHCNQNWCLTHKLLQAENLRMPTMNEFREFLKYLRYSDEEENQNLYQNITEVSGSWRANWIDAYFEEKSDGLYLLSNHIYKGEDSDGKIILAAVNTVKLDDCLMEDRGKHINNTKGISLNNWLDRPTTQGFPQADVKKGELHYWHPRDKYVAWFYANSDWVNLNCYWSPTYANASLGVFACAEGAARAKNGGQK